MTTPLTGSISTDTLRTIDLVETFANELENMIGPDNADYRKLVNEANTWLETLNTDDNEADEEQGTELVNDLIDALGELAPPYCCFGAHEGDAADFGFWPCRDQIEELPRITDDAVNDAGEPIGFADQARALSEDYAFVNDHGNVTVYGANGSIILEIM